MNKYILHTDGGARGNPGPAAVGVVIEGPDIERVEISQYIGETTNNDAEYQAAIIGLKKLRELLGEVSASAQVVVHMDSELVVKQMKREYKVKHPNLKNLWAELTTLCADFATVRFDHVPRELNAGADALVNEALDRQASGVV